MDSSSFGDQNKASQFALRVALQTMKERCISLQKRLTAVEEENQDLRDRLESKPQTAHQDTSKEESSNYKMANQIAELNRQKMQLSEHFNMVSAENRKLWSRLSQIAKEQHPNAADICAPLQTSKVDDGDNDADDARTNDVRAGTANLNLIRSKTFTQHSPNPNLRQKLMQFEHLEDNTKELSLEEITLDNYKEYEMDAAEAFVPADNAIGLPFLTANESDGDDDGDDELNTETRKCLQNFEEIRRTALLQQEDLKAALQMLEKRFDTSENNCRECIKGTQKPEMADKSLETDESLNELLLRKSKKINQLETWDASTFNEDAAINTATNPTTTTTTPTSTNERSEKICPMCGKIFCNAITFNIFREHVETHFIDDLGDMEHNVERNFELTSHPVGDF